MDNPKEWWGLLDINRSPRKAFHAYAETELPVFDGEHFRYSFVCSDRRMCEGSRVGNGHAGCTLPCATTVTTTPTTTTTTTTTTTSTTSSSTTSSCEPLSDECAKAVAWAMSDGIFSNPEWYESLTSESTAEQFQEHLALGGHAGCTFAMCDNSKDHAHHDNHHHHQQHNEQLRASVR